MQKGNARGLLCSLMAAISFGTQPLLAVVIYRYGISQVQLAFFRVALMVPVFLILSLLRKEELRIDVGQGIKLVLLSLSGAVLTTLFLFTSFRLIHTGIATALNFTYPLFVLLFGALFYREKITPRAMICVVLCMVGVALFIRPGSPVSAEGILLALASGLTYGFYMIYLEKSRLMETMGFMAYSFWFFFLSALILGGVTVIAGDPFPPFRLTLFGLLTAFSVTGGLLAVGLLQIGIRDVGSRTASVLSAFEPVTSLILGSIFLKERVEAGALLGIGCVLAAAVLLITDKAAATVPERAESFSDSAQKRA